MRPPVVVPPDPPPHRAAGLHEAREAVLPHALLLQASEEALDDPVLLRRVRRDEFLAQPIVATCRAEAPALEDQAVVATHHRGVARGPQGAEPLDAGGLE